MTRALVVNRDSTQREAIVHALNQSGINSLGARSEQQAVIRLHISSPSLIVWDVPPGEMLPETFFALAGEQGFAGSLVVCANSPDLDGMPYDLFVRKPFELYELIEAVESLAESPGRAKVRPGRAVEG